MRRPSPSPLAVIVILIGLAAVLPAQAVTFTGDVQLDFPASNYFADPGGIDVGMPPNLVGNVSGWDMLGVALTYEQATDTLYVGIDTQEIAGDADGDGDPSTSSPQLISNGGMDFPNFGSSESFTFGLDLDDDGNLDVIAGIPFGMDINSFTVATFQGIIFAPSLAFGTPLPANVGTLFTTTPSASARDIEFTIPNVTDLVVQFGGTGQTQIGIHAFMGSFNDDGIGEDYFPALVVLPVTTTLLPCIPLFNSLTLAGFDPMPGGGFFMKTRYGVPDGHGCCLVGSLMDNPGGWPLTQVPGNPVLLIGVNNDFSTIGVRDIGIPVSPGLPVFCKETDWLVPSAIPPGLTAYFQYMAYPISPMFGTDMLLSNRIIAVAP